MVSSARFRFTATLLGAVLAVVLTVFVPGEEEPADGPMRTASVMPPPQR